MILHINSDILSYHKNSVNDFFAFTFLFISCKKCIFLPVYENRDFFACFSAVTGAASAGKGKIPVFLSGKVK